MHTADCARTAVCAMCTTRASNTIAAISNSNNTNGSAHTYLSVSIDDPLLSQDHACVHIRKRRLHENIEFTLATMQINLIHFSAQRTATLDTTYNVAVHVQHH
jgi:uncharacterized Zn-finger protein